MEFFGQGRKNEFEIAVVAGPSVLKPLKFYCTPNSGTTDSFLQVDKIPLMVKW